MANINTDVTKMMIIKVMEKTKVVSECLAAWNGDAEKEVFRPLAEDLELFTDLTKMTGDIQPFMREAGEKSNLYYKTAKRTYSITSQMSKVIHNVPDEYTSKAFWIQASSIIKKALDEYHAESVLADVIPILMKQLNTFGHEYKRFKPLLKKNANLAKRKEATDLVFELEILLLLVKTHFVDTDKDLP